MHRHASGLLNAAVRLVSTSLPFIVAGSFACEAITEFGFTEVVHDVRRFVGPVVKGKPPMFITTRLAL